MTLRLRLSLAFLPVVIVPLVLAAALVMRGVPHALRGAADHRLVAARAGALALVPEICGSPPSPRALPSCARRLATATGVRVTFASDGRALASTEAATTAAQLAGAAADLSGPTPAQVHDRLATAAGLGSGPVSIVLSMNLPGQQGLPLEMVVVLLVGGSLAIAVGWLLARLTAKPLAVLSQAAARVAAGDLDTPVEPATKDEVSQLAIAFSEITDELRSYVGELESSRDELRRNMARVGDMLSSTHDMGRILTVVLETATASVRATAGAAYVVQRDELVLRAGCGLDGRAAAARLRIGEGVTGSVAASGSLVRGQVEGGPDGLTLAAAEPDAANVISVPMKRSGELLGVLSLYDREDGRPFDAGDVETLRTFAGQAAIAVDNLLLHEEAQRLSITDGLTGLGNYRFFQSTLIREVERAARFGRELGLLLLDLDRFKLVNDRHGHQAGDCVLVELAMRVREQVREVDAVARYGGEELVVVLPETGLDGALRTAARICAAVRETPFEFGELELAVTVSIGAAVFPVSADTPMALVRAADEALYAAKNAGRDQWRAAGDVVYPASR